MKFSNREQGLVVIKLSNREQGLVVIKLHRVLTNIGKEFEAIEKWKILENQNQNLKDLRKKFWMIKNDWWNRIKVVMWENSFRSQD